MELWVNRSPFLKGRVLKKGRPATATVVYAMQGSDGEGSSTWSELRGELEVTTPDGGTVVLKGNFNGHRSMARHVLPGTRLPVKLHPDRDDKLVIDWKEWERTGGLDAARAQSEPGDAAQANAAARHGLGEGGAPTPVADASDGPGAGGGWQEQSIAAWKQALDSGAMSQEEFDQAVADLRQAGG